MEPSNMGDSVRERHANAQEWATEVSSFNAWVGGSHVETDDSIETRDPVTNESIVEVPLFDSDTVDDTVAEAWDAYDEEWSNTNPADRSEMLFDWIDVLSDHVEELSLLESLDTGKPIGDARGEVLGAIDTLEYYASLARTQSGKQVPARNDVHTYTRSEPYGVVGQITPWNFPMWAAAWKLGPALAAGNTSVLKPSATTPLTTVRMAELSAGVIPDGVINVVTGTGSVTGGAVTEHEDIRKVSFTGSTGVGKGIMEAAAGHFAPVTLELGGKSPFLVFPDADLDKVVDAVASGIFYSTGEICDAFSRALVHEDIVDEFTERFVEKAESYQLGDPLLEETTMGPLTSKEQFETVTSYIDIGSSEGANLLTGGGTPDADEISGGWYVEPTVYGDVDNEMRITQEEIFGPVQTIQTFSSYEEAIELANDTRYGLAAGVGTESTDIAHNAAADLEAGLVYVNEYGPILPDAPYGGFKDSGIGRDLGEEALDHYQQTKSVYVNLGDPDL
ncbi:aldehyde dehydrogenase family protein [Halodesulfurarchaeum sp. HSR-GB]|uniref:aldehyde dehydrogenase family protein n=1 Tax=Halodesulfurarchaeum sp. HSR-GB TaxID=3074077 RepID=UPI00285AC86B|nr:aldehyde dehydrogenase family protein [Halodesulfurarchaeum sp. HSR-GB]MDR5655955.1 aldehyde dehydrogenase family protein [Halodesulfurarchaeum sp. HSR-GB]